MTGVTATGKARTGRASRSLCVKRRNRANRRQQEQQLHQIEGASDMELAEEVESAMRHRAPKRWEKIADAPLGEVVSGKLEDREAMRMKGGRRALRTIRYANDQD